MRAWKSEEEEEEGEENNKMVSLWSNKGVEPTEDAVLAKANIMCKLEKEEMQKKEKCCGK